MNTDALELALALHQAPVQRFALRDRPLPKDIGIALQLASAAQPQLDEAAARSLESPETIVEAVRFYLHQVLFEPGTDAYRILASASNADFQQIRQHHIWLQRWLHPDRCGEDWEAALATKVNWAWQQLRNEAARAEYDRSRQQRMIEDGAGSASGEPVQVPAWSAAPLAPRHHWLRRIGVSAVIVVCMGLFYLAATRQDRVDPAVLAVHSTDEDSPIRPTLPFIEIRSEDVPEPSWTPSAAKSAAIAVDAGAAAMTRPPSENPGQGVAATARPGKQELASDAPVWIAGEAPASAPVRDTARAAAHPPAASIAERPRHVPLVSSRAPPETGDISPAPQLPVAVVVPANHASQAPALSPATGLASIRSGPVSSSGKGPDLATARDDQGLRLGNEHPLSPQQVAAHSQAAPPQQSGQLPMIDPAPASSTGLGEVSAAPSRVQDASQAEISAPALPPAELDRDTLARFELARARVRSMVGFFRSTDIDPPDWVDESARDSLARERDALHERNAEFGINKFVLDPPVWQISPVVVSLKASYHIDAKRRSAESGRFHLDMVWHDDHWKISRIEIAPGS